MESFIQEHKKQIVQTILGIVITILFFTFIRSILSKPETYTWFMSIIDEKKSNVTKLLAASTSASTLITLLPNDVGTPIATKLADLSSIFLIILAVLYLEKYLLTILGFVASILLGISSGIFTYSTWVTNQHNQKKYKSLATKLCIAAIVSISIIPISVSITNAIDNTYNASIQQSIDQAINSSNEETITEEEQEEQSVWDQIVSGFEKVVDKVTSSAAEGYEWAQNALNNFVEATAIMLVTSCLIPFLTLIVVVWLAKMIAESILKRPLPPIQLPTKLPQLKEDE